MSIAVRLFLIGIALSFAQEVIAKDSCLGTFSSFQYNTEGGDIQGIEIKIVYTRLGKQAAIQFSEGEPGALVIVPVRCDGSHISLKIPTEDGRLSVNLEGVVSENNLTGKLIDESGESEKLLLPRKKGYWD